jgi:hypothetical protein
MTWTVEAWNETSSSGGRVSRNFQRLDAQMWLVMIVAGGHGAVAVPSPDVQCGSTNPRSIAT